MKYYAFRPNDITTSIKTKKLKIGRIIKVLLFLVFVAATLTIFIQYKYSEDFREFIDVKILRKEISNENTIQIDISSKSSPFVYTYNKYVTILDKNVMEVYTSSTKPDFSLDINISNPIYANSNRFLCVAENGGNKVYLISGQNIIWQKDVEGQINMINLNKNGYVAVSTSNSGSKTIINLYNPTGEELFKTYLQSYASDIEISPDNKYLAIAETNTSGTIIQSDIKIVSIEIAKSSSDNAFVKIYSDVDKSAIVNLKYYDKNKLICMYDSKIVIMDDEISEVKRINSSSSFIDIELDNSVLDVQKQISGVLKSDYFALITNLSTFDEISCKLANVPSSVYCSNDIIAANYGTELEIFNTGGWLIRRYRSSLQEIRNISLTNSIVAIVYKDKVEIINL